MQACMCEQKKKEKREGGKWNKSRCQSVFCHLLASTHQDSPLALQGERKRKERGSTQMLTQEQQTAAGGGDLLQTGKAENIDTHN